MSADDLTMTNVPAQDAVLLLATKLAEGFGSGLTDADGETDGYLDVPVVVTVTGVFGPRDAVTTMGDEAVATVWVSDDANPLQQLRALLDELDGSCVSGLIR